MQCQTHHYDHFQQGIVEKKTGSRKTSLIAQGWAFYIY